MFISASLANSSSPVATQIAAIDVDNLTEGSLFSAWSIVKGLYDDLGASDQVAKGTDLVEKIKNALVARFGEGGFSRN